MPNPARELSRFGDFELDRSTGELRRNGDRFYLQEKPFQILMLLLERPGQLVTREELQKRLWDCNTFVDFDQSLNKAVNRLREVLGDSADHPKFIETLPRRGYRFVAPLEQQNCGLRSSRRVFPLIAALALSVFLLALLLKWLARTPGNAVATNGRRAMAVIEIEDLPQDPSLKWLGDGVVDLLTTDLAQAKNLDVISSERIRNLISREVKRGESLPASQAQRVAQKAGADIFISGTLLNTGRGFRLDLRVQDTASGKVLLADKFEGNNPQAIFSMVDEATVHIVSQLTAAEAAAQPNAARLTSNFDALRAYEEGITYIEREFNDQAAASFRRATEFDPDFAMAYYQLTPLLPNYGDKRQALAMAAQLAQSQGLPEQQRLLIRARQFKTDGHSEECIQTLQTIVHRFPKEIEPRILLGNLLKYQGRLSESAAVLEEAARLDDPTRNGVYNYLAYTYAYQGYLSRAIGAVDKYAALLPPNDPNPVDTRADIYALDGKFDESIAEYKKNLESHAEFSNPELKISLAYLLAGRQREAEEMARSAYRNASGANRAFALNVLGDVAASRGAFDRAVDYYSQAAQLFGSNRPYLVGSNRPYLAHAESWKAAEIYFEQHEPRAALSWARRTVVLGAEEVLGVAYLLLGNEPAAEREFAAARTRMVPIFGDYMAERFIAFDRFRAASYSGQWQRVIDGWAEVPGWLGTVNAFFPGRAHAELAMLPQAEKELRDGLVWVGPGNLIGSYSDFLCYELTQFYLGKVLELEGKKTDAVEFYRAFLSHFANSKAHLPQIAEAQSALRHLSQVAAKK
jgi:DNA-binding winged helix-turn-helix (wHTH) protein/tetratricopeptide (TPR) repeat protein